MKIHFATLIVVSLMLMGCVKNEPIPPSSTTKQLQTTSFTYPSTLSTALSSQTSSTTSLPNMPDKGPIPNVGVNVYHVTNNQTCDAALQYVAQEPKLAYLMDQSSPNRCYPMKYGLSINVGDFNYIEIRESDNNEFYYSFSLWYNYRFSYNKDNIKKSAEFVVNTQERRDFSSTPPYRMHLSTGTDYFTFVYDETTKKFTNTMGKRSGNELIFTSDLTSNILKAYEQAKANMITQIDAQRIANSIIDIIKKESRYSFVDTEKFRKIDEIEFDQIYPFVRKGYVFGSDFSSVKDYYVIEKNGKYGLVNNNKLVVVDMSHDEFLFLMHSNEIYWHSGGDGVIPFTSYYFGGSHGLGGSSLFFDRSLNQATVMSYGDDGPGSYSKYEGNKNDIVPILPYQMIDECEWNDEYSCSPKNQSARYGLLSNQGKILTDPLYTRVLTTRTPLVAVACDDKWGYVNHEGKLVIDCIYEGIWKVNDQLYPYWPMDNYIIVKNQSGMFGVIDFAGKTILPFEYDCISPYYDGQIMMKKNGEWTQRVFPEAE